MFLMCVVSWVWQRFVKNFLMISLPLTKLLPKSSFDKLKVLLTEAPVFTQPKSRKEFLVCNDASLSGLGCVLIQEDKFISYAFR
ncbi:hypothetical protein EPI10_020971 [Gossypium australe]|uniref:Reverse transcriptase/retrotransposon-derived protein RNase H-like domain-containing protein n=1 Tax=Gossypium australe TaxID=47621 RepID=A0A5B6WH85_9ROSI|nr:hypothetical protein EPI10_020971 [Gossypium australe]